MKIHEKILTHYLSCTSPVDKEGYLFKKKKRTETFQRRWYVLKGNLLFYQERPADRHLLGLIVLEGCAVRHSDCTEAFSFSVVFDAPQLKTYRFAAIDLHTRDSWVKTLQSASHCYLSLLTRDLKRQYKEAKQRHGSAGPSSCDLSPVNQTSILQTPPAASWQTRRFSADPVLQSTKVVTRKSPKVWTRRNAHVTPLNGPAPLYGEWPLVEFDPMEEFSKLHDYYGLEVKKAREDWLRSRQMEEEAADEPLIELA
ncbi:sesquipedalian-1 [Neosynchiropus ocellatus]